MAVTLAIWYNFRSCLHYLALRGCNEFCVIILADMNRPKVLIIDDEPLTCKLIATMLKLHGYPSTSLTDPKHALAVIEAEHPSLILLDYHLGLSHGLDILQQLTSSDISRGIPVVMTSGMDYRKDAIEAGARDFLVKPFDWAELTKVIDQVLNPKS